MTVSLASRLLLSVACVLAGGFVVAAAEDHGGGHEAPAAAKPADATAAGGGDEAPPAIKLWPDVPAVEQSRQPYVLVRTLRSVQDEVAVGSVTAHELQRKLMGEFGEKMRDLPIEVWDDVRNVRAAIFFVLSGGDPGILKDVVDRAKVPNVERRLLKGALAYGEGRLVDALGMIHKVDAREVDPSLGGITALIQGTLISKKETKAAIQFFDEARLLSPGTLIDEAALRQEILLLAREGEMERFDLLSEQYSRRFRRSLFASNFRRQFFAGVARQNFKRASEWVSRTETELQKVPPAERAGLYLAIAEESTKGGNIDIARFAASKAKGLSREGSAERARAMLYEGAALVATDEYATGRDLLNAVDLALLGLSDRQLHEAAVAVVGSVGRWPEVTGDVQEPLPAAVDRAQAVMSNVDSLLGGTVQ